MKVAGYPKYEDYRESGVEWVGKYPSDWELTRLGALFSERRKKVSDTEYEPLSVTKNGIFPRLETAAKTNDGENRKLVRFGDFVINSRSDRKGSSGISPMDGSASLINIVLEPTRILPGFCQHLLKSHSFIEEYYRVGRGIVADLWTTRYDEMRTIMVALPSTSEQRAIANFLDEKCAHIDEAVRIRERQIELLRERCQILIQKAVTRGLNPDAPMKDSGVDWIGQIPAHWEIKRVKRVSLVSPSRSLDKVSSSDKKVVFLPMEAISEDGRITQTDLRPTRTIFSGYTYFRKNDVVIAKITPCFENGKGCWLSDLETEYGFGTTELHVFRPTDIFGGFLYLVLNGKAFRMIGERFMTGSAGQKRLPISYIANFPIPVPPANEQKNIYEYINIGTQRNDRAISTKQSQITALKEYKTVLINAAVTGKIRVTEE